MASVKFRFKNQVQFNRELDEFAERAMPDAALAVQKKIAIDLFSGIIEKNPVGNPTLWKNPAPGPPLLHSQDATGTYGIEALPYILILRLLSFYLYAQYSIGIVDLFLKVRVYFFKIDSRYCPVSILLPQVLHSICKRLIPYTIF